MGLKQYGARLYLKTNISKLTHTHVLRVVNNLTLILIIFKIIQLQFSRVLKNSKLKPVPKIIYDFTKSNKIKKKTSTQKNTLLGILLSLNLIDITIKTAMHI